MYPSVLSEKVQSDSCAITRFELTSPVSIAQGSFDALKRLHQLECNSIVRYAYKLSLKALNPSTFERQNANLAVRVFNDFVAQALAELGSKPNILHWHETSVYIKIISPWWDVVNVKTPMKGLHKKKTLPAATDQMRYRTETSFKFFFGMAVCMGRNSC